MLQRTMPFTTRVELQRRIGDCSRMAFIELAGNPIQLFEREQERLREPELLKRVEHERRLLAEEREFLKRQLAPDSPQLSQRFFQLDGVFSSFDLEDYRREQS